MRKFFCLGGKKKKNKGQAGEEKLAGLRLQNAVGVKSSQDLVQHKSMFMAKS